MSRNTSNQSNSRSVKSNWTPEEEADLADWLLAQRLLHEVGQLEQWKVDQLDDILDWYNPASEGELGHALDSDDPELNEAFTTWFNEKKLFREKLTFDEISVFAALEMRD